MGKPVLNTPDKFSFKSTIYSHGWADLLPFRISENPFHIILTIQTESECVFPLQISSPNDRILEIHVLNDPSDLEEVEILSGLKRMFRLNEDYSDFYSIAETSKDFNWVCDYRAGRMLRCTSLWEDMVKMLCTTNCTWRLTQIMTENLVQELGKKTEINGVEFRAFPKVDTVASKDETYLRNKIKMGYRAPYLLSFAQTIVRGKINLSDLESDQISTTDLYKQLRGIKGFGDYAVSNLLKLLGRYDYLGADSWSRQKFADKHNKGKKCEDKKIEKFYKSYGKWAGLFFWMDVSADWYTREKPW